MLQRRIAAARSPEYHCWDAPALLAAFGALALLLTVVGTYGVVSRTVAARRYELCVRLALGSPAEAVVRLVLVRGARATLLGLVIGLVVAWAGARGLSSQFYGVSVSDPLAYGAAAALVGAAASLALYVPARRAARLDPVEALRSE